jgi:hypothetical protein
MPGIPGVRKERFEEALNVRRPSVPLSVLVGQSRYASPMMFLFFFYGENGDEPVVETRYFGCSFNVSTGFVNSCVK